MRAKRGVGFLLMVAAGAAMLLAAPVRAEDRLVVFAAASMKNALDAVNAACAAKVGKSATISYGGSSALAKQIEQGAPADIFLSADLDWMNYISERDLTDKDSQAQLLGNSIVLVAPADSTAAIEIEPGFDLAGLVGDGRLAMANVDAVPAGKYGKAALEKLGIWPAVAGKIAQAENVRAALALVSTGEAPLGIVYKTDAIADPGVRIVAAFPDDTHAPIIYPVALIAESGANQAAAAFLKCLHTQKAKGLFEQQGFSFVAPVASE